MSSVPAGSFTDHPRKIHFRKNWAKPILKFLYKRLNKKLIYLGLPGYRALDVLEWQEFLKIVIAFQAENIQKDQSNLLSMAKCLAVLKHFQKLKAAGSIDIKGIDLTK